VTQLWRTRLPPAKPFGDILHIYMKRDYWSNEGQLESWLVASKQELPAVLNEHICTLRLDELGIGVRMLRILGRLNELFVIDSRPQRNDTEPHVSQIHISAETIRSTPLRRSTRSWVSFQ
jgi:hypothetical protein